MPQRRLYPIFVILSPASFQTRLTNLVPSNCCNIAEQHPFHLEFSNSQRPGVDNDLHQCELSWQTIDTIVDLYELCNCVQPCDKHLVFDSIDNHLSKPQSSLRQQAIKDNVIKTCSLTTYFS